MRIEELGALGMACYDSDFVGIIEGKMSINKDLKIGNSRGQRKRWGEKSPSMRVCIEDYGQK